MSTGADNKIEPARWNACLKLLCRPLDSLDAVQRPAALVFHYDGYMQNGGHSSFLDSALAAHHDELIQALRSLGAREQARIFAECRLLEREADEADPDEREPIWEVLADLDRRYYQVRPAIPEILARYFNDHADSFPKQA
jgi:hypothetical protein